MYTNTVLNYDNCIFGICSSFKFVGYVTLMHGYDGSVTAIRHYCEFSTVLALQWWLPHFYYCIPNFSSMTLGVLWIFHYTRPPMMITSLLLLHSKFQFNDTRCVTFYIVISNISLQFGIKIQKWQISHLFFRSAVCCIRHFAGGDVNYSDILQRFNCCMKHLIT